MCFDLSCFPFTFASFLFFVRAGEFICVTNTGVLLVPVISFGDLINKQLISLANFLSLKSLWECYSETDFPWFY